MDNKIIYILCGIKPNQATNEINGLLNGSIIIHNLKEISRLPMVPNPSPPRPEWDLACLDNRIRTFAGRWKLNFLTAEQMAKAGFYYLGPADRVRCMFCSKELDKWEPTDNPVAEHKRVSPLCTFFKENPGFDVCGLYEPPPITYSTDINVRQVQTFLSSVCIDQKSKVLPANKAYTSFDSRLRTFKNCKTIINQPVRTLCEAGLLYIGNGENDMMLCFCCNQGLKDWEKQDNPWMEHARWSPKCSFVLLVMGKQYVDDVCGQGNNVALQGTGIQRMEIDSGNGEVANDDERSVSSDVEMIGGEVSNFLAVNDDDSDNSVEIEFQPETTAETQALIMMELASQQDQSTVANSVLCKICLKEKIEVFFIPCGHAIACIQCAVTLDQCAICRQNLKMLMRVFVYISEDKDNYPNKLACFSSKDLDEPVDPMLCKMCHKEEMSIAFLPCKHICACLGCATKMKECPLCVEPYFALLQVFL